MKQREKICHLGPKGRVTSNTGRYWDHVSRGGILLAQYEPELSNVGGVLYGIGGLGRQ